MILNAKYAKSTNAELIRDTYSLNGAPAWLFIDKETGEPICTPTANLPEFPLPEDFIYVKSWGENEGILDDLIRLGLVEDTGRTQASGFVAANICKVL